MSLRLSFCVTATLEVSLPIIYGKSLSHVCNIHMFLKFKTHLKINPSRKQFYHLPLIYHPHPGLHILKCILKEYHIFFFLNLPSAIGYPMFPQSHCINFISELALNLDLPQAATLARDPTAKPTTYTQTACYISHIYPNQTHITCFFSNLIYLLHASSVKPSVWGKLGVVCALE